MTEQPSTAYLCRLPIERSAATLRVGRRKLAVRVMELSTQEFVIEANDLLLKFLRVGKRGRIYSTDDIWDVSIAGIEEATTGRHRVVLRRLRDRTPEPKLKGTKWASSMMATVNSDPLLPAAVLLALLAGCLALPGLGDSFGTAPKVRQTVQQLWRNIRG
jgi:hypothetical protein